MKKLVPYICLLKRVKNYVQRDHCCQQLLSSFLVMFDDAPMKYEKKVAKKRNVSLSYGRPITNLQANPNPQTHPLRGK
jgi:hypothetical protein